MKTVAIRIKSSEEIYQMRTRNDIDGFYIEDGFINNFMKPYFGKTFIVNADNIGDKIFINGWAFYKSIYNVCEDSTFVKIEADYSVIVDKIKNTYVDIKKNYNGIYVKNSKYTHISMLVNLPLTMDNMECEIFANDEYILFVFESGIFVVENRFEDFKYENFALYMIKDIYKEAI